MTDIDTAATLAGPVMAAASLATSAHREPEARL
jgi:hypothetical protein